MTSGHISRRAAELATAMSRIVEFESRSTWARRQHQPGIADFTFGNPHDMPLTGLVEALQRWSAPLNKDWFAYKTSERHAQEVVAKSLYERYGVPFESEDVAMTNAGFGALAVGLKAMTDPGDEVIFSLPPWFFYEPLIREAGLVPVKVGVEPDTFDLDIDAIAAAISPQTRIVIVNTPHNPTGRIYPPETLARLAEILDEASATNDRTIYILSDEPYSRIIFDAKRSISPSLFYPNTLVAYSYGKVLLAPGQRLGYLAIPTSMPNRERVRNSIFVTQLAVGWAFPNALLQHAVADLERLSIDIDHLQRKRDRMVQALREIGYQVHSPEGTFYLLPKSPREDDIAFSDLLAEHDVFVLPGTYFEMPGYFRISLTASDEMIERSLPGFAAAWEQAHAYNLVSALANDDW